MIVSTGQRRHAVLVQSFTSIPDGFGGYTEDWAPIQPPRIFVEITPATTRDLEFVIGGSVQVRATHVVRGPWHPQITTKSRFVFTPPRQTTPRYLNVTGVFNVDERSIEMICTCEEIVEEA